MIKGVDLQGGGRWARGHSLGKASWNKRKEGEKVILRKVGCLSAHPVSGLLLCIGEDPLCLVGWGLPWSFSALPPLPPLSRADGEGGEGTPVGADWWVGPVWCSESSYMAHEHWISLSAWLLVAICWQIHSFPHDSSVMKARHVSCLFLDSILSRFLFI